MEGVRSVDYLRDEEGGGELPGCSGVFETALDKVSFFRPLNCDWKFTNTLGSSLTISASRSMSVEGLIRRTGLTAVLVRLSSSGQTDTSESWHL